MKTTSTHRLESTCTFCSGKGYFQLLLGGSETCSNCKGTGKDRSSQLSND
ncbi:YuiA family protein [Bacillus sp. FSL W8-0445]|jgi:DnaJ-class molecular chaperone|nr:MULTISPECIES: YuiA family protein [Bacillus]MBJ7885766.1 YuiA family protein [Bacillaceae bacterium HSR45]MDP4166523.1 YuiA family protein [Bacillota bacterium]MBC9089240.1 YuiA family protein [Bacillus sp. Y1]MBU8561589.1 YuiA family protein [Bacillus licheniformis]MBU8783026.1 YuiA family protein [Bacillus licheniformis]